MPYCDTGKYYGNGARIFYRTYGHGPIKVLLIIGLAGTHDSWGPQVKGLTGTCEPNEEKLPTVSDQDLDGQRQQTAGGIEVCCFDNRRMGRSLVPTKKSEYSTTIMAKDACALLDHLGWKKAHAFGHSMGGMIACKLAAIAPERISFLALLNVTGGGFECFPKIRPHIDRKMISLAIRFLKARTPEQRAAVDLETHYTKEYLDECIGSSTRRRILYQVNEALMELIKASESNISPQDWSNLPEPTYGCQYLQNSVLLSNCSGRSSDGTSYLSTAYNYLGKLQLNLLYLFGVFVMGFKYARDYFRIVKPIRVAASN